MNKKEKDMENNNNKLVPKLRFPGFKGEWEPKPLSNYLFEHKTKSDGKCEVHSVSVTKGVVNQVEYLGRSFAAADTSKYNLAKTDDIIYTKSPTGDFPYGIVKQNKNPYNVIVSPLYAVYTPINKHLGYILDSNFESPERTNNYLSSLVQKGAKNTIQISNDTFISKLVCFPSDTNEQQKIAECLSEMDNLITAQERKVELLKVHKKGLMQQMFPRSGETTPRLRFPGVDGDWEEKNLGSICDSIMVGFPFKGQDITDDVSGHPILRAYCIGEGIIKHGKGYDKYFPYDITQLEKYKVQTGDIVISMDGSVGRNIAMVSKDENNYLLIQRVARLRITEYPIQLIYQQIISQRFKDYATGEKVGAVIAHISQKQIESFPVLLPQTPNEQQKIAECLSELDKYIVAESAKLELLKNLKKGLMQQLFPEPLNLQ